MASSDNISIGGANINFGTPNPFVSMPSIPSSSGLTGKANLLDAITSATSKNSQVDTTFKASYSAASPEDAVMVTLSIGTLFPRGDDTHAYSAATTQSAGEQYGGLIGAPSVSTVSSAANGHGASFVGAHSTVC